MQNLTCFDYGDQPVRIIDRGGEPWFVLADVCRILGLATGAVSGRIDDEDKGLFLVDTLGGPQKMTLISESGFYVAVLRSDKAEARPFRKWVTGTVLPSIRQNGAYVAPGATVAGIAAAAGSSGNLIAANALLATVNGMLPELSHESRQALAVGVLAQVGITLPAPQIEPLWQMSAISDLYGVNASVAGKRCKPYGLQNDVYGKWLITTTPSGKQVRQFHYNELGRSEVERILADMVEPFSIGEFIN